MLRRMTDRTAAGVSVIWAITLGAALWQFVPAVWDDTDDMRMAMIASGIGDPDGPDSIVLYAHVLVGSILSRLYTAVPAVPWYTMMLLGMHLLSVAGLSFTVLTAGLRTAVPAACATLQIAVACYFWTHLQFTTSAAALALSGLSLVILGLSRTTESHRTGILICGGLCLTGSSLVRLQSTQLVIVLSGVTLLVTAWKSRRNFRLVKDGLIASVTILLLIGGTIWQSSALRATPDLATFHQDLVTYSPIVNSKYLDRPTHTEPASGGNPDEDRKLDQLGMTWNDIRCMKWWYMIDEDVFSSNQLASIADIFPVHQRLTFLIGILCVILPVTLLENNLFLLFAGTSLGLLLSLRPSKRQFVQCVLIWGIGLSIMAALLCLMKLPERVFIPAGMTCFMMTLLTCTTQRSPRTHQASEPGHEQPVLPHESLSATVPAGRAPRGNIWLSVMSVLAAYVALEEISNSRQSVRRREMAEQTIEQLSQLDDDLHVVLVPFPFDLLDPLQTPDQLRNWKFIYLDGHQRSPRQKKIVRTHLGQTLPEAVLENPNVRFVVEPEARSLGYIRAFYRSHYRLNVQFPLVRKLPWGSLRRLEKAPVQSVPAVPAVPAAASEAGR